jgi:membrane-associated phospholipid phosphatase
VLPFEQLAALYFAALAVTAATMRRPRRWAACGVAVGVLMAIVVMSRAAPLALRAWAAHAYLAAGYWIPSLLATRTSAWFEDWLVGTDRHFRWLPALAGRSDAARFPAWFASISETAYLLCYPLVPVAFLLVWIRRDVTDVNRFWMAVLGAGFACYGLLPWLVSRPPRLLSGETPHARGIARVNALVLDRVSHRLNTFPSGHVSVSVASALSVWAVSPVAATVIGAIALGVSVGAVTGRYHYVLDVIAGAVVGVLSALMAP